MLWAKPEQHEASKATGNDVQLVRMQVNPDSVGNPRTFSHSHHSLGVADDDSGLMVGKRWVTSPIKVVSGCAQTPVLR